MNTTSNPGDGFIPASQVWKRYGITSMSLWRWSNDEAMNFPAPDYFGRFRYWKLSELVAWEASRPRTGVKFGAALSTAKSDALQ
jgi:predicted DNA-binding transcriptional regulator AlpA